MTNTSLVRFYNVTKPLFKIKCEYHHWIPVSKGMHAFLWYLKPTCCYATPVSSWNPPNGTFFRMTIQGTPQLCDFTPTSKKPLPQESVVELEKYIHTVDGRNPAPVDSDK